VLLAAFTLLGLNLTVLAAYFSVLFLVLSSYQWVIAHRSKPNS
jgi:hypothetical protein